MFVSETVARRNAIYKNKEYLITFKIKAYEYI